MYPGVSCVKCRLEQHKAFPKCPLCEEIADAAESDREFRRDACIIIVLGAVGFLCALTALVVRLSRL